MKRMFGFMVFLVFAVLMALGIAHAGPPPAIVNSWDSGDALVVDKENPANYKMQIGSRLYGPVGIVGATTYAAQENPYSAVYATPTTTLFIKTTGAVWDEAYRLGDGVQGQKLTIVLKTDGGKDFYVTPKTTTGFTNVQLNDAKDSVTLTYINDTVGWVVTGNSGATIN